jgi:hypothetical protein
MFTGIGNGNFGLLVKKVTRMRILASLIQSVRLVYPAQQIFTPQILMWLRNVANKRYTEETGIYFMSNNLLLLSSAFCLIIKVRPKNCYFIQWCNSPNRA